MKKDFRLFSESHDDLMLEEIIESLPDYRFYFGTHPYPQELNDYRNGIIKKKYPRYHAILNAHIENCERCKKSISSNLDHSI